MRHCEMLWSIMHSFYTIHKECLDLWFLVQLAKIMLAGDNCAQSGCDRITQIYLSAGYLLQFSKFDVTPLRTKLVSWGQTKP